jgi:hypothetical protein
MKRTTKYESLFIGYKALRKLQDYQKKWEDFGDLQKKPESQTTPRVISTNPNY